MHGFRKHFGLAKMRILQVILMSRLSGAELLAKGVAIGHQRGVHDVCIASLHPENDDFTHISAELRTHGVHCLFPSKNMMGKLGRLMFLHRAIRGFRPDIIFAHATIPVLYVRALPTRRADRLMHSGANDFSNRALLRSERLLSSRAKAVIGVSQKNIDNYV